MKYVNLILISKMAENEETKVEDIARVYANYNHMLHRKRPWLNLNVFKTVDNLKVKGFPHKLGYINKTYR